MATLSPVQAPIALQLHSLPPFAYLVLEVGWMYQIVTATRGEWEGEGQNPLPKEKAAP